MGMTKRDYLQKKGLLRPDNDDVLYIVFSTQKGVKLEEWPVLKVGAVNIHFSTGEKTRSYHYSELSTHSITMDIDKRFGERHYPYHFNEISDDLWEWSKYAYFDKENAEQKLIEETKRIEKTYLNRKNIDDTIKKLSEISYRIDKLKEHGHGYLNIIKRLTEYGVPDPLPALIHKLMYSCDNKLGEEAEFLKEVKKKQSYHPPMG